MARKSIAVVVFTAVLAALIVAHVHDLNGPWYWKWSWRRLPWWTYVALLIAAAPFVAAQWAHWRGKKSAALILLAVTTLALQLAAISCQPGGIRRLPILVTNVINTSYWTDAAILHDQQNISLRELLYLYPQFVPQLHLHARYRPPGPLFYYLFWITLLGDGPASAWAGGLGIALIAALAPIAAYRMIRFFGKNEEAAFCAASFLAMAPSLILFLPQFDQTYVTITCLILLFWGKASRNPSWRAAIVCGALLALGTLCSYIFLILGCFIAVDWMLLLIDRGAMHFYRATRNGVIALATLVALYAILWLVSGFDPIATFQSVAEIQTNDLLPLIRPFPLHIVWDLLDFGMGSGGWISYLLIIFYLSRIGRKLFYRSPEYRLVLVALIQIMTVALAALLPGETARLWMLMIPLLLVPVGFELANWSRRSQWTVYACLWLMTAVICQNMSFLYMGPELDGERQYDSWPKPGPGARR